MEYCITRIYPFQENFLYILTKIDNNSKIYKLFKI